MTTREQIIASTCDLMENLGYHATGLSQIVKESGAPKGSTYYYFPEGKEEIADEAIQRAARQVGERISTHVPDGEGARAGIVAFMRNIAYFIEQSGFQSGGPLTSVAMETATTSERLNWPAAWLMHRSSQHSNLSWNWPGTRQSRPARWRSLLPRVLREALFSAGQNIQATRLETRPSKSSVYC